VPCSTRPCALLTPVNIRYATEPLARFAHFDEVLRRALFGSGWTGEYMVMSVLILMLVRCAAIFALQLLFNRSYKLLLIRGRTLLFSLFNYYQIDLRLLLNRFYLRLLLIDKHCVFVS
jgi:hypothetical protein